MHRGTFIAFEGGEGSGKDTMIDRLKEKYAGREDIVFTREPGGTPIGERIRSILLSPESKNMSVRTELLLFLAARLQLVSEVIAPALAQGKTVITNRFGLSTLAYQIHARKREEYLSFLDEWNTKLVGNYVPGLYLLLDVEPEVGLKRVEGRNDGKSRFDAEALEFHTRVREGYLRFITRYPHRIINANHPLQEVWARVDHEVGELVK